MFFFSSSNPTHKAVTFPHKQLDDGVHLANGFVSW